MTLRAIYRDGVVVLPPSADIPDGAALDVRVVRERRIGRSKAKAKSSAKRTKAATLRRGKEKPTLNQRLKSVIGKAKGLPSDFAAQHDHYVHGTPKK